MILGATTASQLPQKLPSLDATVAALLLSEAKLCKSGKTFARFLSDSVHALYLKVCPKGENDYNMMCFFLILDLTWLASQATWLEYLRTVTAHAIEQSMLRDAPYYEDFEQNEQYRTLLACQIIPSSACVKEMSPSFQLLSEGLSNGHIGTRIQQGSTRTYLIAIVQQCVTQFLRNEQH